MCFFTGLCQSNLFKPLTFLIGGLLSFSLLDAIGEIEDFLLILGFNERLLDLAFHL